MASEENEKMNQLRDMGVYSLKSIQQEVRYKQTRLTEKNATVASVPFLKKFLREVDEAGDALTRLGEHTDSIHSSSITDSISQGFHFGSVAIAALDFVRIPLIYLYAYLTRQKVPLTLNNNAKWLYATVLLGLTIAALVVPGLAPILAVATAGVMFAGSAFMFGKMIKKLYDLNQQSKKLDSMLLRETIKMDRIQQEAGDLELLLAQAKQPEHVNIIYEKIAGLKHRYTVQKQIIEDLRHTARECNKERDDLHLDAVIRRVSAVVITAIMVAGAVTAIFFPFIGVPILTVAAITGGVMLLGRLSLWLKDKLAPGYSKKLKEASVIEDPVSDDEDLDPVDESTLEVFKALSPNMKPAPAKPLEDDDEEIEVVKTEKNPLKTSAPRDPEDESEGERESEGEGESDSEHDPLNLK